MKIVLEHLTKKFPGRNKKSREEVTAVNDFHFEIPDGKLVGLLGPSGCGKSTTLNLICGLQKPTGGRILFGEDDVTNLPPEHRGVGLVFQNYALYPHMTVEKNISYGLKNMKVPENEIKEKVDWAVKVLGLEEYRTRKPKNLSGGQRQRVALGRAIVKNQKVFLMDEPLSNLDAKLRVEMRTVIKNIQHSVGITTIYVTHDQEEAMAVSDRIAVMNGGVIQHIGTPKNIYQRPANLFVSTFIGRSNVLKGKLVMKDGVPHLRYLNYDAPMPHVKKEYQDDADIVLSVRPEELLMHREAGLGIKGVVDDCVFLGLNTHYFMHLDDGTEVESIQESTIDSIIAPGTEISLTINTEKANLFAGDGSHNLLEGVQNDCEI